MAITTNTKNLSDIGMGQGELADYIQHILAFNLAMKAILVSGGYINSTKSTFLDGILTSGAGLKGNLTALSSLTDQS